MDSTPARPWQGTRREPDAFDALRGGTLTDAGKVTDVSGMTGDHDPLRAKAEAVSGNLILVQPDNPMWLALEEAIRMGDIYRALSLRNRMLLSGKLTITKRFSPA